jgi:uncharacterized protein YwgA
MTRRDWLLLFVGLDPGPDGLEPVRLQKGLFLLAREGGLPAAERYWLVPYNYGPMSPRVYRDVDALVRAGLVEQVPVPGYRWGRIRPTAAGRERVHALRESATAGERRRLRRLDQIHATVTSLSFAALLEMVYARYPQYASASVFRRGRGAR